MTGHRQSPAPTKRRKGKRRKLSALPDPSTPAPGQQFVTTHELSAWIRRPVETLAYWRKQGSGPPWIKLGHNSVLYDVGRVRAWLDSKSRGDGAQAPMA